LNEIRIEVAGSEPERLEPAGVLLNAALGEGMYPLERLREDAADPEVLFLVALSGETVVGAALARLLYAADVDYYIRFGDAAERLFREHRVGSLEAMAVAPGWRRQGLGTRLVERRLEWLVERGCDAAVAVAWLPAVGDTSEPVFKALGFTGTEPVADFYLEESIRDGWTCPVCQGPDHCAAAMYYSELLPR
jgi:GNAT superfamily N-acetyltransferase